jgi:hypothetical protein
VGVTIDIGGRGVEVATVEDIERTFARMAEWLREGKDELPVDLQGSKTTAASPATFTYVPLGGPKAGWLWDVMRIAAHGDDPTATVTGSLWAYVGVPMQDSATIGKFQQLIEIPSVTLPNEAFYGRQQVIVRPNQQIVLAFKSLPASTQINCSGLAIQYRDPAAGSPVNTYRQPK